MLSTDTNRLIKEKRALRQRVNELEKSQLVYKHMEKSLKDSEEKYRTIFESANDALILLDKKGKILDVNKKLADASGYDKVELVGKRITSLTKILSKKSLAIVAKNFVKRIVGINIPPYEVEMINKSGEKMDIEINAVAVRRNGRIEGDLAILRDITDRKRAEKKVKENTEKLLKAMEDTIASIALIIEMRDPYTAGHQRRVAQLAKFIASEMDIAEDQIKGLHLAGLVHDIGKVRVPTEILTNPHRLTDAEFSLIKMHPTLGYEILEKMDFPWPIAKIVHQHHERINGSGYPQGLSRDEIILEAKIIAVADVVEAMASHRPYRLALGLDKALEEIACQKDILFEPRVVDACLKLFKEEHFKLA